MLEHLFVYGSLRPGEANAHYLTVIQGDWHVARIRAQHFPHGTAHTEGYPVIIPDDNADWVEGLVLSSENLQQHWHTLDTFEGPAYRRELVAVKLDNGNVINAFAYVLNK